MTDIPGLKVGHWTNLEAGTGCTVILCPEGAVAGVDVRGGAPGTRELALLDPVCMVEKVHAILLGGGSAFGLAAADGVMRWLEEQGVGFNVGVAKVPIVPAAILFDLPLGRADVRQDAAAGYAACLAATAGQVIEGNVGAGTGATVGKLLGFNQATKGGLGTASRQLGGGIVIAALAVVNAAGDVIDPPTQRIIAGARQPLTGGFADSIKLAESRLGQTLPGLAGLSNTTLAVVATNVALTKAGATKVAQMAHDGLARTIRPVHTMIDGDLVFALSLGQAQADAGLVGALAAEVLGEAVVRAVWAAEKLHGIPAAKDLR
ncbi:MAG: P1 family peptidase [Chloroflexi bacterium]|nr:P1 family peptidase [Chloroflexota bacterium]